MQILVVGAGATGGYFGARLAQAGRDVTFLVREKRKQQLTQNGLQVKSPYGDITLTPKLALASELNHPFDLIILTVKSFGLAQAMEDIAPAVGPQTLIMPVLNGMRHIDILREKFGAQHVIGGLCKIHATLGEHGEIIQMSRQHKIFYGDLQGDNGEPLHRIDAAFRDCGVENALTDNIISDMWEKWLLLSTLGAVTCLSRGNTQQVLRAPGGEALLTGIFNEVLAVITACGYQPRQSQIDGTFAFLANPDTPMTSSMYRDLSQGFAIEADQIIGDLVARGRQKNIPVPLLNAVWVNLNVYLQQR